MLLSVSVKIGTIEVITVMRAEIRRHEERKYLLRLAGSSISKISADLGVSPTAVSYVSLRRNRSARIELAIARELNRPVNEVFPDTVVKSEVDSLT
ncbi:transcriptional regulator with XRE-family HTH domain [Loktanella ponticola]|uniref:Transcriptional regulator with XRE-family HTH domain n=1 Tax=Yoonia ponticola TaxID=1524255 RepID=A0A7W9F1L5_9RHOB|nr:transcriptional regulator with XRE-family HTH domain [Yoonia ponticola]